MNERGALPLPPGWENARIGDVTEASVQQGGPHDSGHFVYVDIGSIDTAKKEICKPKVLPSEKAPSRARQRLETDDVLVSMTRPNLNAVALLPSTLSGAIGSSGFHVLRSNHVAPQWLFYAVQTRAFVDAMSLLVQGALYPAVRPKDIDSYKIPLPPLSEQHRIVAAIEQQFTRLDAAVADLLHARAKLKRYRAAVLAAACSGRLMPGEVDALLPSQLYGENDSHLRQVAEPRMSYDSAFSAGAESTRLATTAVWPVQTESTGQHRATSPVNDHLPSHWRKVRLGELAKVGTGATPLRSHGAYYENGTTPWITSGALNHPFVRGASEFVTDLALRSTNLSLYPVHTLLVAMYGEGRTRGRCSELMIESTTNQAIAALVFGGENEQVRPWVKLYLTRSYEVMRNQATGGVQPNLNLSIIRNLEVPLPPLAEQHRIVAEVERRLSVVDEMEAAVAADLKRADRLRQAILRRAFAGKLVPQDPDDEPARVLLDQARAERAAQQPAERRGNV